MKKWSMRLTIAVLVLLTSLQFPPIAAKAAAQVSVTESLEMDSSDTWYNDIVYNTWNSEDPFTDKNGKIVTNGIGFSPDGNSRLYVTYNLEDYKNRFSTFETSLSLDKRWTVGDFGLTQVLIYANDNLIYSKPFNNSTPVQQIKLALPKNTDSLTLEVVSKEGSKGTHNVIFGDPILTNKLPWSTEALVKSLADIGVSDSNDDNWDFGKWYSNPFQLNNGDLAGKGYGIGGEQVREFINFYIDDYKYTTFESKISVEKTKAIGDRGKTEVIVYADNKKIYSEPFTNTTAPKDLKLPIPPGTKVLSLELVSDKGGQGARDIIFANPVLSNSLKATSSFSAISLADIGVADDDGYYSINQWYDDPLQLTNGHLTGRAIGLIDDYDYSDSYVKFFVGDYSKKDLSTRVSLDGKWITGSRGTTAVTISADSAVLFNKAFINTTKDIPLTVSIPEGTQYLEFKVSSTIADKHGVIFDNPLLLPDKTAPKTPAVSAFKETSTKVTGTAEKKATIEVKKGTVLLGKGTVTDKGTFSITIPKQAAGVSLSVYAKDASGNVSKAAAVKVADAIAPAAPSVSTITNASVKITGKAEAYSDVKAKAGSAVIGSAKADKSGNYSITIKAQKAGTIITVTATDAARNVSKATSKTVTDAIAPNAPSVNKVTGSSTSVSGKAEASSTITVKAGTKVIGTGTTTSNGTFTVKISKQKKGTKLSVTAADKAKNVSKATAVTVQ